MGGDPGGTSEDLGRDGLVTLVPPLVTQLDTGRRPTDGEVHRVVDGSMLSADISGFTSLTEELAAQGRRGAEVITTIVNACFADLIRWAEALGGEVLKFGGDAVLLLFAGEDHARRAVLAGQTMQLALGSNRHARDNDLSMTVGVASGPIHAMVVGSQRRDLVVAGPTVTETLVLEGSAGSGQVAIAGHTNLALGDVARDGASRIEFDAGAIAPPSTHPDGDEVPTIIRPHVPAPLRRHYAEYADLGAEHRRAAIGFVLVEGLDDLIAEHGSSRAAREIGRIVDRVDSSVRAVGASFLHSDAAPGGIKILVGAGVPRATANPAEALLRAALAIRDVDTPLSIRVGVQVGSVFAGFLGPPHRRTFTVMGDAVNTAARMSGQAADREIVAVTDVIDTARASFVTSPRAPVTVKGKSAPLDIAVVDAIASDSGSHGDDGLPLVGRTRELDWLVDAVGRPGAAAIVGPAGSGKSRLVRETTDPATTLLGSCGPYTTASPYAPFWAPMRAAIGLADDAPPAAVGPAIVTALADVAPDLAELAPLVAPVFGTEMDATSASRTVEEEFRSGTAHRIVENVLALREPPIATIVVEDVQWLDDASRELVAHLVDVADERRWSTITTARPDPPAGDGPAPPSDPDTTRTLVLGELPDDAMRVLVDRAGGRRLDTDETDRVLRRAQGNPLFAIELLAALERGEDDVPDTIEELIVERIERLDPRRRTAVRLASVLGSRFAIDDFEAFVSSVGYDAEHDLRRLDDVFEVADSGSVRFRQLLHRDAAYGSLSFRVRKSLHLAAGTTLEQRSDDVGAISALLSQHFEIGGDRRRCWTHSVRAAQRATSQHSAGDAASLYRRALGCAPRGLDRGERSRVHEEFAQSLIRIGELSEAHRHLGRARDLADADDRRLRLLTGQGRCRDLQGRFADALRVYSRVLAQAPDDALDLRCDALLGRASVMHRRGDNRAAHDLARDALDLALVEGSRRRAGHARMLVHTAGEAFGAPGLEQVAEDALADVRASDEPSLEAELLSNLGVSAQLDGDLDTASDRYAVALALKERVGDVMGAAMIRMNLGEVELDRGRTDGVEESLDAALSTFERGGFQVGSAYTQGLVGRHRLMVGDAEGAVDLLTASAEAFDELGGESYAAAMELFLAEALVATGDREQVRVLVERNRARLRRGDVFDGPALAAERLDRLDAALADDRGTL